MSQEWAIRDEATGEWWDGDIWGPSHKRYKTYHIAAQSAAFTDTPCRLTARIVEAPREMTDAEAEAWLHGQGVGAFVGPAHEGTNWVCGVGRDRRSYAGVTLHDAIRATYRALEKGK